MSMLAVVAAVAAAVLLVASARAFSMGGLRHRLPSIPASSAEQDLSERSFPRWIWIVGGCLVVLPVVALPFPIPLLVIVVCLVGYRLRHLAAERRDRRRARAVDAEIPQLLDLLAAGSSAGLAAPLALRRAADGLRGPLSDEVRMTTEAVELGARWRVELHAMSDRLERCPSSLGPRRWDPPSKQRPRNSPPRFGRRGERRSPSAPVRLR